MKQLKKILIPMLLISVLIISACSKQTSKDTNTTSPEVASPKTITYKSENGAIVVPSNPQRIVVLYGTLSGHVMALGGNIVGVEKWSMDNPRYKQYLTKAVEVSDENLEKIVELKPDLIIAGSTSKNLDKLAKIAPTVSFTYGKLDYLTRI